MEPLGTELGIDLDSLVKGPPQMIDGSPVTAGGIRNWKTHLGLGDKEADAAVRQLIPAFRAVLKGLSHVDPHRGRHLLTRICRLIDLEIQDSTVRDAADHVLALSPKEELKEFSTGKEFIKNAIDIHKAKEWPRIEAAIDRRAPVQLKILTKNTLHLPWNFMPFENLGSEELGTHVGEAVLPVTMMKVVSTYVITQGGLKFEISLDRVVIP